MPRVNHLRTEGAPEVLLIGIARAGERQNFTEGPPETLLRQVPFLRVNHLRTEDASEVLLRGVARAGEGVMVSLAQVGGPRNSSERGLPRR